tara:strand:- start:157 stop:855 length:699 start_codon:yes stop_codon:yes gene_type:complete
MNYIFDIDGTLTPSRMKIDSKFEFFFSNWIKDKKVFLVTGSDKDKTIEQIGENIWSNVTCVYQSCGNQVWENTKLIRENSFFIDSGMRNMLEEFIEKSKWKFKFDNNFEQRVGLVNFSIIGRNCTQEMRDKYYKWDLINKEREKICEFINTNFSNIEASVGGQISIDIYEKGKNKAQVLDDIFGEVIFFGDRMEIGGNDYPLAKRLSLEKRKHKLHKVKNPHETWEILKENY